MVKAKVRLTLSSCIYNTTFLQCPVCICLLIDRINCKLYSDSNLAYFYTLFLITNVKK